MRTRSMARFIKAFKESLQNIVVLIVSLLPVLRTLCLKASVSHSLATYKDTLENSSPSTPLPCFEPA